MKVIKGAFVLALFLGYSEAIALKSSAIDLEYEEKVVEEEDNQKSKKTKESIENHVTELQEKDTQIMKEYAVQLDQSQRNIDQGEMGQTLAQTKIMSIQNDFDLLATNIQDEFKSFKQISEMEKKSDQNASP